MLSLGSIVPRKHLPRLPPFVVEVYRQTFECRNQHRCYILPFEHGELLSIIVAAVGCKRILELGCALGFSTLWLAHGAPSAHIDTIDHDAVHAQAARANFERYGIANRVTLYEVEFELVLPTLRRGYDLALFDGWEPTLSHLQAFERLVRRGGVLISSNLHYTDVETREYLELLFTSSRWRSAAIGDGNTVMSVRT